MTSRNIQELQSEIERLQSQVISLLLRNLELEPPMYRRNLDSAVAKSLLEESEMCLRCSRMSGVTKEIAVRLEKAGNKLMAKAVEIEATLQRHKWKE